MKSLVYYGPYDMRLDNKPMPEIKKRDDITVNIMLKRNRFYRLSNEETFFICDIMNPNLLTNF